MDRDDIKALLDAAAYKSARQSKIKPKPLADILDIQHGQFLNKTCMTTKTAHLNIYEAVELESVTGDRYIFNAICTILGEQTLPAKVSALNPGGLMAAILKVSLAHGDVHRTINEAVENDRMIDSTELQDCVAAISEVNKAFMQLQLELIRAERNKTVIG